MNLLNPTYSKTAPGLLNTTPNYTQNSYPNFFKPGNFPLLQSTVVEPPVVEAPMEDIYGNSPGDTMGNGLDPNNGTQNVEDMTTADLEATVAQMNAIGLGLGLGIPGAGLAAFASKNAMQNELASRQAMGADGHGNNNMGDPTAPGGIGGSAGSAAATGGGGFGPDMGGDGGFGL